MKATLSSRLATSLRVHAGGRAGSHPIKQPNWFAYGTTVSALLFFAIFFYYPFLNNLYYMFTDYNYIGSNDFVGLKNIALFFHDHHVRTAFTNTFIITLAQVVSVLIISLLVAVAVFYMTIGKAFVRSVIFSTTLVPAIVAAIIFKLWFGQELGLLNNLFNSLHLPSVPWLLDPRWGLTGIVIVGVWGGLGYNMVIYLAGLSNVDTEILEAAAIDGANAFQRFMYLILPQLKPTMVFLGITLVINSLKTYGQVAVLTNGGPYGSTQTVVLYMFQKGFFDLEVGYASVIAFALFLIILVITLIQMRVTRFYADDIKKG